MPQLFTFSHLESAVHRMAQVIRKQDFLTYFRKFSLVSVTETSVTLGVGSVFHKENLSNKFYDEIYRAITDECPSVTDISLELDDTIDTRPQEEVVDCRAAQKHAEKKTKKEQVEGVPVVDGINSRVISDRYQLENFIIGPATQLAHAACEAVARRPGSSYNPLYLYGNVGLGKTHLLQATANAIRTKNK